MFPEPGAGHRTSDLLFSSPVRYRLSYGAGVGGRLGWNFMDPLLYDYSLTVMLSLRSINPLPDMPILGSFNSAANKDMM